MPSLLLPFSPDFPSGFVFAAVVARQASQSDGTPLTGTIPNALDDGDAAPGVCESCLALSEDIVELKRQVATLRVGKETADKEAARAKELMMQKDKQLMMREKKIREKESGWAAQEKSLHRRSMQTSQVRDGREGDARDRPALR